jgi:hypothetical protein
MVVGRAQAGGLVAAILAASSAVALGARVPSSRPVAPPALGIRFNFTSDWGIAIKAALHPGWKWEGFSPGQIAWVRISSHATPLTLDELQPGYVNGLRASTAKPVQADPNGLFTSTRTKVAGAPAVKIEIRGLGFTLTGVGEATTVVYALVHAGVAYVIEFDSSQKFLARYRPTIERLIASIRFTQVA